MSPSLESIGNWREEDAGEGEGEDAGEGEGEGEGTRRERERAREGERARGEDPGERATFYGEGVELTLRLFSPIRNQPSHFLKTMPAAL